MLRFMALNAAVGVLMGLLVFAALVFFDTGGVATRIFASDNPWQPVVLIAIPLCLTFGAGAVASAIMLMPYSRKFSDRDD
jgi:ABC-type branched-subunit amino acid transport system permease subunit